MKNRYIRKPDGGWIRKKPGKLKQFLAESAAWTPMPQEVYDLAARHSSYESTGAEPDYSTDAFDISKLKGYEIVQFGVGSGGGYLLRALGPAQLVCNIIDPGEVEAKHTSGARTIYTHHEIGMSKVEAARYLLERDFPGTKVNPLPFDVAEIPNHALKNLLSPAIIVIIAIDDPEQILRINDIGYGLTEIIQVASHRNADSGHIAISIPYVTACLRCTLDISESRQIRRLDSEPAASIDIMTISQMAAKIALEIMYAKATGRMIQQWDPLKNLVYIANKRQELSPDGPGLIWEQSHKRSNCPICNV
ncbi:ThiF family adenylyltransferase [Planctomycetota bacterium]